jgi:hypothetical protein
LAVYDAGALSAPLKFAVIGDLCRIYTIRK